MGRATTFRSARSLSLGKRLQVAKVGWPGDVHRVPPRSTNDSSDWSSNLSVRPAWGGLRPGGCHDSNELTSCSWADFRDGELRQLRQRAESCDPRDERPAVNADAPPPPVSGGTLAVTDDGTLAVAADPDRDRVVIVALGTRSVRSNRSNRCAQWPTIVAGRHGRARLLRRDSPRKNGTLQKMQRGRTHWPTSWAAQ